MSEYNSNIELAQEISARIGNEPIPFESVSGLCMQIYQELGGDMDNFDDVYSILLEILPLAQESHIIDDSVISTGTTWSSNKINTELSGKQDELTAGNNIQISGNTISATDTTYTAGANITIDGTTINAVIPNVINDILTSTGTTWSSTKITAELANVGFDVQIVQTLPVSGDAHTVYFVPSQTAAIDNVYDEYMYINNAWEQIGSTAIDLSDYYNKSDVNTLLTGKQNTLTAGNNITITGNTISATDTTYSAGSNIEISGTTINALGYRFNTTTGAFAEGDRDIDDAGSIRPKPSATGVMAHAEGTNTIASGYASHAEGESTSATVSASHAEGSGTNVKKGCGHAEGRLTIVDGFASHTEGDGAETGGNYASATTNPKAADSRTASAGDYAHAEGLATIAYGVAAHAEGRLTLAKGNNAHAEGNTTNANGGNSHAEGNSTTASGAASHAEGNQSIARGETSHVEGYKCETLAGASNCHAEGGQSICNANVIEGHAEGHACEVGGNYTSNTKTPSSNTNAGSFAHAEGNSTIANGVAAHSEGRLTLAKGNNSHAEGNGSKSNGVNSHAEGQLTQALGGNSHSEGGVTIATGGNSHTEGRYTQALNSAEHAGGSYNISHQGNQQEGFVVDATNTLRSVGIGTADDARKNAVEVMQNGDMYILGVGGYDGVHISSEAGYSYTMTLQNMVAYLNDCIDTLTWQMKTIKPLQPNQIRYTTNDNTAFDTYGSLVVDSNEYSDGTGIITFDTDLTTTGDYNFSAFNQDNLTSIELPKSEDLYRIDAGCFESQTYLKQFTIPINITEIGDNAFSGCSSLEILKYEGTMDMWGNISLGSNWYNGTLLTQVICLDGVLGLY